MRDKMNSVVNYTSSLTSEPFLYEETKVVVMLRLQGYTDKEIREKIIKNNLWGYNSIKQATRLLPVVLRRIIFLDDTMADVLVNGNEQASKMIALNLVMKNNLLFSDFVKEIYFAKVESKEKIITKDDISDFFERKRISSDVVASWNPCVFKKLGQVYIRILYLTNLVDDILDRGKLKIYIVDDYVDIKRLY